MITSATNVIPFEFLNVFFIFSSLLLLFPLLQVVPAFLFYHNKKFISIFLVIFLFLIFSGCELYHSSKKYFSTIFINTSLSSILLISHLNSLEFGIFLVYQAICFLISLIAVTSGLFSNSS